MVRNENEIPVNDELIVRYLTGEAGPEEAMALEDWLQIKDNRVYFESLQSAWHKTLPLKNLRPVNKEKVWTALQNQLKTTEGPKGISKRYGLYLKIAATVLLLIITGSLVYFLQRDYNFSNPVSINTTNELREMVLPDKSQIVLNRNSTITFDEKFKGKTREVHFRGEGFFAISPNLEKPFIIHTKLADIIVVGTSFNIAETNEAIQVSLVEGKVMVITPLDTVTIEKGQTATVKAGEPAILEQNSGDPNNWAYATRKFSFKNTRLSEVFRCIEKSFPYTIAVHNKAIENCRLTANFDNTSADYMMSLIAETLDLSVTKNDNEFILEGNGCE